MMNFCTLFDSGYLQRGLALYDSFRKTCDEFHLYVMAFDDKAYEILKELNLPSLTVVHLKDFETQELLAAKPTRSRAEYCWTCGPSVIWYFIERYNLESCTYVDADLLFYRSPQILFDEIGDNSVAITDHYAPYDIPQGRYCVQFMYFKNDEWGMKALKWWRDSCIEWCFARHENGKFGDQKYLEQFPVLFKKVHIIITRGAGIASWNFKQYNYNISNWSFKYENEEYDIVFVHYHALGLDCNGNTLVVSPATFDISKETRFIFDYYANSIVEVYRKYLGKDIKQVVFESRSVFKRIFALFKFKLRNVAVFKYIYEKYLRPEYKGYNKK
jgi:hypothetical protein